MPPSLEVSTSDREGRSDVFPINFAWSLDQISNRYWLWHGCQVTLNSKRSCHQNAQFIGHISTFRGSSLIIWLCYCLRHTVKKHLLWQQREIVYRAHNVQNVVQSPNSPMLPTMNVLPMWSSNLNPVKLLTPKIRYYLMIYPGINYRDGVHIAFLCLRGIVFIIQE